MTSITQLIEGQQPKKIKTLNSRLNNLIVKHYKIDIQRQTLTGIEVGKPVATGKTNNKN